MAVADQRSELDGVGDLRTLVRRASERWGDRLALTFDESGERLTFGEGFAVGRMRLGGRDLFRRGRQS